MWSRITQTALEKVGLAEGADDAEFQEHVERLRAEKTALDDLLAKAQAFSAASTQHLTAGQSLGSTLRSFLHQEDLPLADSVGSAYGSACLTREIDRIQREKLLAPIEQLIVRHRDIQRDVSARQGLVTDLAVAKRHHDGTADRLAKGKEKDPNKLPAQAAAMHDAEQRLHQATQALTTRVQEFYRNCHHLRERIADGLVAIELYVAQQRVEAMQSSADRPAVERISHTIQHAIHEAEAEAAAAEREARGEGATKVFGTPLETHPCGEDGIPLILSQLVTHLDATGLTMEGIFRISGSAEAVSSLKAAWQRGEDVHLGPADSPFDIAALLKMYLRELPQPLVPGAVYRRLLDATTNRDPAARLAAVQPLIDEFPELNRRCAAYLFQFLARVAEHSEENMMTPDNIAICLAPNVIRDDENDGVADIALADLQPVKDAMKLLVVNHEALF